MSNRERWIVYPLLFFAIALSVKTQLVQVTGLETQSIVCRELTVTSADGDRRVQLVGGDKSGVIAILDQRGVVRIVLQTDEQTGQGRLDIGGPDRTALVRLEGGTAGGLLELQRADGQLDMLVGHSDDPAVTGLFALYRNKLVSDAHANRELGAWGQFISSGIADEPEEGQQGGAEGSSDAATSDDAKSSTDEASGR